MKQIDLLGRLAAMEATALARPKPDIEFAAPIVEPEPLNQAPAKREGIAPKGKKSLGRCTLKHLTEPRHEQADFFVADIFDALPKDDLASMEYPLFALRAGDKRVRTYDRDGLSVTIKPGSDGCATIHDKDVWIYCVSQMVEALNRGRTDVGRVVRFTAYDFLVTTNRLTSGTSYERMKDALDRLRSTTINTNIETAEMREARGFGLVDSWRVVEEKNNRMVAVEVVLPEWLWRSVQAMHVLTLSPDYFRIRKPIDRRLYELARKHCGKQKKWAVGLETLKLKCGTTDALRNFREAVRRLASSGELPDYNVYLDAEDRVVFTNKKAILEGGK